MLVLFKARGNVADVKILHSPKRIIERYSFTVIGEVGANVIKHSELVELQRFAFADGQ